MTFVTILAAMAVATAAVSPAETPSITVSYADLNLASPAGRAALETRVARAARRVCDGATTDLRSLMATRKCITLAQNTARPQIDLAVAHKQDRVRVAAR